MRVPDDRELAERFAELRREVERATPPFEPGALRARRRRPATRPLWIAATLAAAALIVVAVLAPRRRSEPGAPIALDLDATHWRAPTDFLLTTPGAELLHEVPDLGVTSTLRGGPLSIPSPETRQ